MGLQMNETTISAECNYQSDYVTVNQHQLHYIKSGNGIPVVFVHGIPTYSYLWRNIIPHLDDCSQCIAIDLLGFGLSDKPEINYDLQTYQNYFKGMLEALQLNEMILVLHGFGSVIGLDYASKNPEKIKGLVLIESHLRPTTDVNDLSLPIQEMLMMANNQDKKLNTKISQENFFIEKFLPACIMRNLTEEEMNNYRKPFSNSDSRKALLDFMQITPSLQQNKIVMDSISHYSQWLAESNIPKLLLYALPGFITSMSTVHWAKEHLPETTLVDIGEALHIPQESEPEAIGFAIRQWLQRLC